MAETASDETSNTPPKPGPSATPHRRLVQAPVPPMDADGLQVVVVGTALWLVATVVLIAFRDQLAARNDLWWIWVGVAGSALGGCGIVFGLWRRYRRQVARRGEEDR